MSFGYNYYHLVMVMEKRIVREYERQLVYGMPNPSLKHLSNDELAKIVIEKAKETK